MTTQWESTTYSLLTTGQIPPCTIQFAPEVPAYTLKEAYIDGKRWYVRDGNDGEVFEPYPSITTVLSATDVEGNAALKKWRQNVGTEKAASISKAAADNGTNWHNFCEMYLSGKPYWNYLKNPGDDRRAATIAAVLNANITRVLFSESRVMSSRYQVAGRMDLGVELADGRLAIVDFKTGKKRKYGNRIEGYALQTTFYADAMAEMLGRPVDTIVIVQLLPTEIVWQESHTSLWAPLLTERLKMFATQMDAALANPTLV